MLTLQDRYIPRSRVYGSFQQKQQAPQLLQAWVGLGQGQGLVVPSGPVGVARVAPSVLEGVRLAVPFELEGVPPAVPAGPEGEPPEGLSGPVEVLRVKPAGPTWMEEAGGRRT